MRSIKGTWPALGLVVLLASLVVAGCAPAAPSGAPAGKAIELKLAHFAPETDALVVSLKEWMKTISEKTNGRVKFTPYYAGSLVSLADSMDAVREGSVDVGMVVASAHSGKVPDLSAFEPIGAYSADSAKYAAMLEKAEPVIKSILEQQKLVYLWMQPGPGVSIATRNKHLKTAEDWKGLKVRVAGRWHQIQMRALGASPVAIDPGEVYQALQTGTVDGLAFINSLMLSFKTYEVAPYITHTDLAVNLTAYAMNKGTWDRLSAEDQKVILEASKQASRTTTAGLVAFQSEAAKKMESSGAKFYTWTAQERADFLKATDGVWEEIRKVSGPQGKQLVDIVAQSR